MQVPSLTLRSVYIAIDKNGNEHKISDNLVTGVWEMTFYLEKHFGIKTSTTTVYNCKKVFTPLTFKYGKDRSYMLAWCNWVLNYPRDQRADFFENEKNPSIFYNDNPIVDIKLIIERTKH